MQVTVRLFAGLRERAGADRLEVELPAGACAGDLTAALGWLVAETSVVVAVDGEYAGPATPLHVDAEVALIPPVSGGAEEPDPVWARIVEGPLDEAGLLTRVRDARAGGIALFLGVTREVPALEYEAYAEMALAKLRAVAAAAVQRHGLCRAAVEHRIGTVPLSEASVAIAVSAPHRGEAFDGARQIIDELKQVVPIWKREEGRWVEGQLPGPGQSH